MVSACRGIDEALAPIVGHRGVAALFERCLHLTARKHPWLVVETAVVDVAGAEQALRSLLAQRGGRDAADAGLLFLTTFDDLLISLIGAALTERLLGPVWAALASGSPVQDLTT